MKPATERFVAAATNRGVEIDVRHWPEGTRTAADAADAVGCEVAQIVKSLVLMADDQPVVALTSGANRVDTRRLATALDAADVRMADADEAREATGYAIGGTPPFGYPEPLPTIIDADLLGHDEVWAAAGTPDSTFPIVPQVLAAAAEARSVDLAER